MISIRKYVQTKKGCGCKRVLLSKVESIRTITELLVRTRTDISQVNWNIVIINSIETIGKNDN